MPCNQQVAIASFIVLVACYFLLDEEDDEEKKRRRNRARRSIIRGSEPYTSSRKRPATSSSSEYLPEETISLKKKAAANIPSTATRASRGRPPKRHSIKQAQMPKTAERVVRGLDVLAENELNIIHIKRAEQDPIAEPELIIKSERCSTDGSLELDVFR